MILGGLQHALKMCPIKALPVQSGLRHLRLQSPSLSFHLPEKQQSATPTQYTCECKLSSIFNWSSLGLNDNWVCTLCQRWGWEDSLTHHHTMSIRITRVSLQQRAVHVTCITHINKPNLLWNVDTMTAQDLFDIHLNFSLKFCVQPALNFHCWCRFLDEN